MARPRRAGTQSRREIDRYRALVAAHPNWTNQHIAQFLNVRHQEVSRWRTISEADPGLQELHFSGQITYAVLDTLVNSKQKTSVKDADKVIIAEKAAAGLVGGGAPALRELMDLMPAVQRNPAIRKNWMDPTLRWGLQQLKVALIDVDADAGARRREQRERRRLVEVEVDAMNFGPRALEFLRSLETWGDQVVADAEVRLGNLEALREQERPVMAMPYFMRAVPKELRNASARLGEVADQLWEMADAFEAGKDRALARPRRRRGHRRSAPSP